jgi:hypothetical protein
MCVQVNTRKLTLGSRFAINPIIKIVTTVAVMLDMNTENTGLIRNLLSQLGSFLSTGKGRKEIKNISYQHYTPSNFTFTTNLAQTTGVDEREA